MGIESPRGGEPVHVKGTFEWPKRNWEIIELTKGMEVGDGIKVDITKELNADALEAFEKLASMATVQKLRVTQQGKTLWIRRSA